MVSVDIAGHGQLLGKQVFSPVLGKWFDPEIGFPLGKLRGREAFEQLVGVDNA